MPALMVAPFSSDEERWKAVVARDPAAEDAFFYSVRTTGVYCRPVCPSRLPLRKNVRFYLTCREAERAGFRACQRCQPSAPGLAQRHAAIVARACRLIESAETEFRLDELSLAVGISRFHLHRLFKATTGVTPKAYAAAYRHQKLKRELVAQNSVTDAIYAAGFQSGSRFYESSHKVLGMKPGTFETEARGRRFDLLSANAGWVPSWSLRRNGESAPFSLATIPKHWCVNFRIDSPGQT